MSCNSSPTQAEEPPPPTFRTAYLRLEHDLIDLRAQGLVAMAAVEDIVEGRQERPGGEYVDLPLTADQETVLVFTVQRLLRDIEDVSKRFYAALDQIQREAA